MDKKIEELQKKIEELEKEIEKRGDTKDEPEKVVVVKQEKYEPLKILYEWISPQRPFVKRNKAWFLKVTFLALIFILLAAMLQDFMIILVICVVVLVVFLLGSIPPGAVKHQITNKGIRSIGTLYKLGELKQFWVAEKNGQKIVYVDTSLTIPSRLVMLVSRKDEMTVVKQLSRFLDYKEPPEKQGWLSKLSDGVFVSPRRYRHLFGESVGRKKKSPAKKKKDSSKKERSKKK